MKMRFCPGLFRCYFLVLIGFLSCKRDATETPRANDSEAVAQDSPLFTLISPEQSNVLFQNTLSEGLNTNVLMYEYLYNGGGVATGDLNGDGLIDLYFTSNMGQNALYINEGKFKFKEAATLAKATGRPGPWKTGVTMVDINGDQKLDLYLCYSGAMPEEKRKNQLFINLGNDANNIPIFEEQAGLYGLDSAAFSNQIYFFDYDHDGDLDALLLNHNPKSLPILNEVSTREFLKKDDPLQGVRLFQQANGIFRDVTPKAGISGSALTYGLGLGISDLNNDGWVDFYVSNDYAVPDYLYINNGDGTFTNQIRESIGHTSHFSMGNDIADINNDGHTDIVTLDMLPEDNHRQKLLLSPDNYEKFDLNVRSGFHNQYMRNMLQLNNGDGTFSEIGQLAGISNTDWSWAALLADYDNDGWKDLYVTNGYYRDYTNLDFINYMDNYVKSKGRLKREDVLEIIKEMPASNLTNYFYSNTHLGTFKNNTATYGLAQPANSNGAAYADLDNDGDLDLIVNNINKPAFIYRNESQTRSKNYLQVQLHGEGMNSFGIGSKVTLFSADNIQELEQFPTRGYLSSVDPMLHFGLDGATQIDSLRVRWNRGKVQTLVNVKANQVLVVEEKNAKSIRESKLAQPTLFKEVTPPITFRDIDTRMNDFKRQSLLIGQYSHSGPCMIKGDVNGDGREDVFIGGSKGQSAALFLQGDKMQFVRHKVGAFEADNANEDIDAVFFDANADGNLDVYVASGGYHDLAQEDALLQDRLYLGDGHGGFTKNIGALPKLLISSGCVASGDANGDGYPDLFVGGRLVPGHYPETPTSTLLINDGHGNFSDKTLAFAPELQKIGMVTDAVWVDMNGDKAEDLIVVGEWMPLSIFEAQKGIFENKTAAYFDMPLNGWWNTIEVADLNADGKPDIIAGNMGTNTQFRVSEKEPAVLYYKDFDANESIDPLFTYYIQGKSYPYLTRDELLGQLARLRSRFTSYKSYADATMTDIFEAEELQNSKKLSVDYMETSLFFSTTGGKLEKAQLPLQAQYSPVCSIAVSDFDHDGHTDLLLFGNNLHFKLRLGRYDANYGMFLAGDGNGDFQYIDQSRSGLSVKGAVKSSLILDDLLLLGINDAPVMGYRISNNKIIQN